MGGNQYEKRFHIGERREKGLHTRGEGISYERERRRIGRREEN